MLKNSNLNVRTPCDLDLASLAERRKVATMYVFIMLDSDTSCD